MLNKLSDEFWIAVQVTVIGIPLIYFLGWMVLDEQVKTLKDSDHHYTAHQLRVRKVQMREARFKAVLSKVRMREYHDQIQAR